MYSASPNLFRWSRPFAWRTRPVVALILVVVLLPSVARSVPAGEAERQTKQTFEFEQAGISFSNQFAGARLNDCVQVAEGEYHLLVRPENAPINDSVWYAFRVSSEQPRTITVRLVYQGGTHRYVPKTSRDGIDWQTLPPEVCRSGRRHSVLQLDVGSDPTWVSAQELMTCDDVNGWMAELAKRSFVNKSLIGRSVWGRPIFKLDVGATNQRNNIFILARQHPPEVTGAIGMMNFVEAICAESELAVRFRGSFHTTAVPLANPDGVEEGHWRHNARGVDLNRDWECFEQPETRALRDELLKLDEAGQLYLFIDFHSTYHDVFYTQGDAPQVAPNGFTRIWLAGLQQRLPRYVVRRHANHEVIGTSQSWVHRKFHIPAITFEFGDSASRQHIRRVSRRSATEMMRLLLALVERSKQSPQVADPAS